MIMISLFSFVVVVVAVVDDVDDDGDLILPVYHQTSLKTCVSLLVG